MCSTNASCLFEVGKVKSSRVGPPAALLRPERRVREDHIRLRQRRALRRERVAEPQVALDVVEHQVHQRQPVRVRHQLHAVERPVLLELLLLHFEVEAGRRSAA